MESSHLNKMAICYLLSNHLSKVCLPPPNHPGFYFFGVIKQRNKLLLQTQLRNLCGFFFFFHYLFSQKFWVPIIYIHTFIYSVNIHSMTLLCQALLKTLGIYKKTNQLHRV